MPVIAPKKISERSRLRMLARQLNCDGKNFTISNPVRHKTYYYLLTLLLAETENMVNARDKSPIKVWHARWAEDSG
jgi:hypothetical protein